MGVLNDMNGGFELRKLLGGQCIGVCVCVCAVWKVNELIHLLSMCAINLETDDRLIQPDANLTFKAAFSFTGLLQ